MKLSKLFVLGSAVALSVTAFVPSAGADVVITGGLLDFDPAGAPTIGDFAGVTLNGNPQLTSLQVNPFTIIDPTGSAAGWNVLLTVPDLVNAAGLGGAGDTILASNVSMTAPTVRAAAGSSLTGVAGHASAGAFNAGEKIVDASLTNGMGTYLVSPAILKLTVPANASVGTYVSTATISVNSGP